MHTLHVWGPEFDSQDYLDKESLYVPLSIVKYT